MLAPIIAKRRNILTCPAIDLLQSLSWYRKMRTGEEAGAFMQDLQVRRRFSTKRSGFFASCSRNDLRRLLLGFGKP